MAKFFHQVSFGSEPGRAHRRVESRQVDREPAVELEIKPGLAAKARISGVILIAVCIAGTLVYLLTGGGRVLFASKSTIYTYVPDAAGLGSGAEVRLSGIPIGKVRKIEVSGLLDPQRIVKVEMRVDTAYLPNIPADSETSITADNLVGWQYVSIDEGKSKLPVAADGVLRGEPLKQAADRADLIKALQDELQQVDDVVTQMSSPETPIGALVNGEKEYDQLLKRIDGFQIALRHFERSDQDVAQALFSDKLYNDVHAYVTQMDSTMAAIQRGEGAPGKLFASDDQYNAFVKQLKDLRASLAEINAGRGSLGSLLHDDAEYRRIRRLLSQTDAMIASFNAGQGSAGQLIANAQLYESLTGSLRRISELLADLRKHPQTYLRVNIR